MATEREIKQRIDSIKNISQVTRAMQAVAASKMQRAQQQVESSRAYARQAREMLSFLAANVVAGEQIHPLLQGRPEIDKIALVLITPDRGLCGGLPNNMIRHAVQFMREQDAPVTTIAVGRKGRDFMLRHGQSVYAEFTRIPDEPALTDVTPIARVAIDGFVDDTFDHVFIGYTDFINTLTQRSVVRQLLPIERPEEIPYRAAGYIFEPDPGTILGEVLPRFTELQVYQAVLEALASEHSARMVAMRNATENAEDLVEDLTLTHNKVRQENITREMLDIAGGAEALAQAREDVDIGV